jgi:dynein heavy chain
MEGKIVPFKVQCGLFVTLNPYALGRTKLPSNLKNLFRIVTMIVPDSTLIA